MSRIDNKQRKKIKREEKKQRQLKAQRQQNTGLVAQKRHTGKVMGAILILMTLFGAAAVIFAYS